MARRSAKALLMALLFGAMVGFREATGVAPPPPILTTERVEWLAPEPEGDDPFVVVFAEPEPLEAEQTVTPSVTSEPGLLRRAWAALRGFAVRG